MTTLRLEVRRHGFRLPGHVHLSAAGVRDARTLGETARQGRFVVTSTEVRTAETAVAMGFAVQAERMILSPTRVADDYLEQITDLETLATAPGPIADLGRQVIAGIAEASGWTMLGAQRREDVLVIAHQGTVEAALIFVASECRAVLDGPLFSHLEGFEAIGTRTTKAVRWEQVTLLRRA